MLKKVQIFKALDVEIKKQKGPAAVKEPYRGYHSLKEELSQPGITIVAEVAGGNPLRGQVRENFRASTHAKSLVENGAKALSVATDRFLYYGEDRNLPEVRPLVKVPVLRRDFILEEYQVEESKILGADAIYLVAAMLETDRLAALNKLASTKGLDVVIEVSSEADLARALEAGAEIICVVGRDLDTWEPSWELALELVAKVPEKQCLRMVEASIQTLDQIRQIEELGVHGIIIGDVLLDEFYPGKRLAQILSGVEVARKPGRSKPRAGALSDAESEQTETSAAGGRNAVNPKHATLVKPQPPSQGEKELPVAKLPVASKKAEPKAVPPAKAVAKKAEPKAVPAAKPAAKKAEPKAVPAAKPAAKKAEPKSVPATKPAAKKAEPKAVPAAKKASK
ncbi:indole-3-glycerol-phosphate synthase [Holophaga foetida]|uniref:indole-3-glycerol-phosphate synthase n=1 Tax=Holophaga foetida TaxID=35839 RepID=UPI0002474676|nr:indole-3-glycerol-phosphate synthase [Holophaga foetida]